MNLTNEYIRGLIDGEGCFSFCTSSFVVRNETLYRGKVPAFQISMHVRDKDLIEGVRDHLGLKNKVYVYKSSQKDGIKRGDKATLIVRKACDLRMIIVPFFYGKLRGHKGKQFKEWLEKIGSDERVGEKFKIIHRLYKCGYWEKIQNIPEKFRS